MQAVLGIAGSRRDASAALSIDGRVIAAVSEDALVRVPGIGYAQAGGAPVMAINACLTIGGLGEADLSATVVVSDHDREDAIVPGVDPIEADAIQASRSDDDAEAVVIASVDPPRLVAFSRQQADLRIVSRAAGWEGLTHAAAALARQLGVTDQSVFSGLDRLGAEGQPEFLRECAESVRWTSAAELSVSMEQLQEIVDSRAATFADGLRNPESVNVRVQETRRNLAASFMETVADVLRGFAEHVSQTTASSGLVCGGELFENAHLNTRVYHSLGGRVSFSSVPGRRGRAIGASLRGTRAAGAHCAGLALGPEFSEHEIKGVLENCRLDYVYEPDWARLVARVSKMLARGVVVGWFHGRADFGPTSLGTRSVLCDPSLAYVRENVNGFLRKAPVSDPLPISLTRAAAERSFGSSMQSPHMLLRANVPAAARASVRAALDGSHSVQFHTVTPDQAPELCELLEVHFARTGVPGLINLNLVGHGEPMACSPRDAVRTFYSSAIDALVIGRFLLMKDHWLLRSDQA